MLYAKVPRERIPILIGKKGSVKKEIERRSGAEVRIDSDTGDVTIVVEKARDPVMGLKAADVVRAIGRGFSPERAYRLFEEDIYLEILDIHDFVGKSKRRLRQVRARLIGTGGRARKTIEDLTGTYISIYGDTVAIIGDALENSIAREAVVMLIEGSEHSSVYHFLERRRSELIAAEMGFEYYERGEYGYPEGEGGSKDVDRGEEGGGADEHGDENGDGDGGGE